jgi:hypothetical protein
MSLPRRKHGSRRPAPTFRQVLATELPSLQLITRPSAAATVTAATATTAASNPPTGTGSRSERLRIAAWLLALFGALWPAWGPLAASSADGGGGGWCASRPAAALLELLYLYLPALRPTAPSPSHSAVASVSPSSATPQPAPHHDHDPQQQQQQGADDGGNVAGGGPSAIARVGRGGHGGAAAALVTSWAEVWEAAGAAGSKNDLEVGASSLCSIRHRTATSCLTNRAKGRWWRAGNPRA